MADEMLPSTMGHPSSLANTSNNPMPSPGIVSSLSPAHTQPTNDLYHSVTQYGVGIPPPSSSSEGMGNIDPQLFCLRTQMAPEHQPTPTSIGEPQSVLQGLSPITGISSSPPSSPTVCQSASRCPRASATKPIHGHVEGVTRGGQPWIDVWCEWPLPNAPLSGVSNSTKQFSRDLQNILCQVSTQ